MINVNVEIAQKVERFLIHSLNEEKFIEIWNDYCDTGNELYFMRDFDSTMENIPPSQIIDYYENSKSDFDFADMYFRVDITERKMLSTNGLVTELLERSEIENFSDYITQNKKDYDILELRNIVNPYGFKYDIDNGYSYISKNGIKYDLLEGTSLEGKKTSDMIFIMRDFYECLDDEDSYNDYVNYVMGATFFKDSIEEYTGIIESLVDKYETKNARIVEKIKANL